MIDLQPRSLFRILLGLAALAGLSTLFSEPGRADEPPRYDAAFEATIVPSERAARVVITLGSGSSVVEWMRFAIDPMRHTGFEGDGEISVDGSSVEWHPPADGGSLRYAVAIDHLRDELSYDARCARTWAIFRGGDLFPPVRVRTHPIAHSRTRLTLRLPEGWSAATPYTRLTRGRYQIQHPERRFDRPVGWFLVGKDLGAVREEVEGVKLAVVGPAGNGVRRLDILALFRWNLPAARQIFGTLPDRFLVVSAGDPMWRGGLSGPKSVFIHANRPLITEDATSPVLHELVHSLLRISPGRGGDWIVEGLADLYSLELLRRSGTLAEDRYGTAIERIEKRARNGGKLRVKSVDGDTMARAVVVLRELDARIRSLSGGARSLDDVVRTLAGEPREITTRDFQRLSEGVAGAGLEDFFAKHAPEPASS